MQEGYTYHGFISYAHTDESCAAKLHNALETFPVPKAQTKVFGKTISPIFRDASELTAHHSLSDKIRGAVQASRFLIVLCSPASKDSHWVNEEIRLFRKFHGNATILCALIEGTPSTSFPPALLEGGQEPIAANLSKSSFRLGVAQLAAAIIGVGLDDILQRENRRYRRRVTAVMAGSISTMLVMGALTWTAVDARREAEQRRDDAEEQIEFMITDLKDDLEAVGRLSTLETVGHRAVDYYSAYELSDHDDDALGRRARVFHYLGEIQSKLGELSDANRFFQDAYAATAILLERTPNKPDRIFDHAQSAYWVADSYYNVRNFDEAQHHYETYLVLATRLIQAEGPTERAQLEMAYAHANLGQWAKQMNDLSRAEYEYGKSMDFKRALYEANPDEFKYMISLIGAYSKLADLHFTKQDLSAAIRSWMAADRMIEDFTAQKKNTSASSDARTLYQRLRHMRAIARLMLYQGDVDGAQVYIEKGLSFTNSILSVEPNNMDALYEKILFHFLDFEVAYINEHIQRAYEIFEIINTNSAHLPADFRKTRRFVRLESTRDSIPLYLSILSQNRNETHRLAAQILPTLPQNLNTIEVDKRYQTLVRIALVDLILDNPKTGQILAQIQVSDEDSLSLLEKQILATHMGQNSDELTNILALQTVFQHAHKKYSTQLKQ